MNYVGVGGKQLGTQMILLVNVFFIQGTDTEKLEA